MTAHHVGRADRLARRPRARHDADRRARAESSTVLRGAVERRPDAPAAVVELVGEPGIGKSRLVRELRTLALGFTQLTAAGEQYAPPTPFFAVAERCSAQLVGITPDRSREEAGAQLAPCVDGVMPDLAPWLPLLAIPFDAEVPPTPETERARPRARAATGSTQTVETFLERVLMMPTLLVVEDAHWLDDSSRFLLRSPDRDKPAPRPWLVCMTTRPPPSRPSSRRARASGIELEPLDADAAATLALSVAEELALSDETVDGARRALRRQPALRPRARQRGATRRAPRDAARVGREPAHDPDRHARAGRPDAAPLRAVVGAVVRARPARRDPRRTRCPARRRPRAAGSRLARVRRRTPATGRFAFRHDLVRATAYEGLSFARRREIHGRVGAALERAPATRVDEEAALLSLHFFEAGDYAQAWRYAVSAGRAGAGQVRQRRRRGAVRARARRGRAQLRARRRDEVARVARGARRRLRALRRLRAVARRAGGGARAGRPGRRRSWMRASRGKQAMVLELRRPLRRRARRLRAGPRAARRAAERGPERTRVRATLELNAGAINYRPDEQPGGDSPARACGRARRACGRPRHARARLLPARRAH